MVGFIFVLVVGKPFIKYLKCKKFGEKIRTEGPASHMSKKGTPTMGGVLIVASVLFSSLVVADITNKLIILLLISLLGFAGIGFVDDYKKFTVNKTEDDTKNAMIYHAYGLEELILLKCPYYPKHSTDSS